MMTGVVGALSQMHSTHNAGDDQVQAEKQQVMTVSRLLELIYHVLLHRAGYIQRAVACTDSGSKPKKPNLFGNWNWLKPHSLNHIA